MEYRILKDWISLYDTSISRLEESFYIYISNNYRDLNPNTKLNYKEFKEVLTNFCSFINDELVERWS